MMKELKNRIRSLESILKITSAMKLISATQFNRLRSKATHTFEYLDGLMSFEPYSIRHTPASFDKLLITIGSDRGLCGGYNHAIKKQIKATASRYASAHIGFIGSKVAIDFKGLTPCFSHTIKQLGSWDALQEKLAPVLIQYKSIDVLFTQFHSINHQEPKLETIPDAISSTQYPKNGRLPAGFALDETEEDFFSTIQLARLMSYLVRSQLCEHSSRMLSMDKATKNTEDMISHLQLKFNKERQAMITKELSETVAGAQK